MHGVGNYLPGQPAEKVAARRSADWAASVATGLGIRPDALDFTVAYYAPLLHAGVPATQAAALDPDRALDALDSSTDAVARSWIEALDLPEVTVQGRLAVPLRHAVTAAADRFSLNGRLTKLFVAVCFPEVARYLAADDAPARAQAREHVATAITDRRARIVIAHSLGTVVAYEALHARPDLEVDLLITLGSPLALPSAVFPRLQPRPGGGIGLRSANVRRWVNISDYGDPIAILRPFKTYFLHVGLDLTESVGLFDFHRAAATDSTAGRPSPSRSTVMCSTRSLDMWACAAAGSDRARCAARAGRTREGPFQRYGRDRAQRADSRDPAC